MKCNINKAFVIILLLGLSLSHLYGKSPYLTEISPVGNEKWWGGLVGLGEHMPYAGQFRLVDLAKENRNNQSVPLLVSSHGRYIWSEEPFTFEIKDNVLYISSDYEQVNPITAGKTQKEAYTAAGQKHFQPSGVIPDPLLFSMPQYNTWIELMYNQNQADILKYAYDAIKNDFPKGVFMIDDNWNKYYGNFDFKPEKFPDPKGMIDELHQLGFKVMVWVCPFVSPDSPEYRRLQQKGYLIKIKNSNEPAIINWWNGKSASYDFSNPEALNYFVEQLKNAQAKYGIDGFKFDAGDIEHYNVNVLDFYDKEATANDMSEYWAKIGLEFPFNEYRACWKMGGQALVQRLGDKNYEWEAVQILIPEMIASGLNGYAYTCPDMIGGGQYLTFLNLDQTEIDQELIVRSCQIHALMPMMQFSVAPWRILSEDNLKICARYACLHEQFGPYILEIAKKSAQTGEPIVRHLEYEFPHQGFIDCKDQFMLGDKYLVAPMVTPGTSREVVLPRGTWKDEQGKRFKGGRTINIDVPIDRLPYFERVR